MATKPKDNGGSSDSFVPFYENSAQIYMSLKLSKDGLSRTEDTEVLKGMYDENANVQNVGWKIRRRVFGGKGNDDDSGAGPQ